MKNNITILSIITAAIAILVVLSSPVIAQQAKPGTGKKAQLYTYKCHLQLEDEREVIRDYRRQPRNVNGNLERLLAKEQVAVEKGKRLSIISVFECVEQQQSFSSNAAQKLDSITLR